MKDLIKDKAELALRLIDATVAALAVDLMARQDGSLLRAYRNWPPFDRWNTGDPERVAAMFFHALGIGFAAFCLGVSSLVLLRQVHLWGRARRPVVEAGHVLLEEKQLGSTANDTIVIVWFCLIGPLAAGLAYLSAAELGILASIVLTLPLMLLLFRRRYLEVDPVDFRFRVHTTLWGLHWAERPTDRRASCLTILRLLGDKGAFRYALKAVTEHGHAFDIFATDFASIEQARGAALVRSDRASALPSAGGLHGPERLAHTEGVFRPTRLAEWNETPPPLSPPGPLPPLG